MNKRILISGASGLIGQSLANAFSLQKFSVIRLVRHAENAGQQQIQWSPYAQPAFLELTALEDFDIVIHLSGANVAAHRWTDSYKREIFDSRVKTTSALASALARLKRPPDMFLCASAVGIYGNRGDEVLEEDAPPGTGFLANVCSRWEAAADPAKVAGIRTVHLRLGTVLSPDGGALAKLLPLFRLGLGGRLGSGRQRMSWISLPDLVSAVFHIIGNASLHGSVNVVAPHSVTNAAFTEALAHALDRRAILPAPAFALRLALGEMADEALLASAHVVPTALTESGFHFKYPDLAQALDTLLRKQS